MQQVPNEHVPDALRQWALVRRQGLTDSERARARRSPSVGTAGANAKNKRERARARRSPSVGTDQSTTLAPCWNEHVPDALRQWAQCRKLYQARRNEHMPDALRQWALLSSPANFFLNEHVPDALRQWALENQITGNAIRTSTCQTLSVSGHLWWHPKNLI